MRDSRKWSAKIEVKQEAGQDSRTCDPWVTGNVLLIYICPNSEPLGSGIFRQTKGFSSRVATEWRLTTPVSTGPVTRPSITDNNIALSFRPGLNPPVGRACRAGAPGSGQVTCSGPLYTKLRRDNLKRDCGC